MHIYSFDLVEISLEYDENNVKSISLTFIQGDK